MAEMVTLHLPRWVVAAAVFALAKQSHAEDESEHNRDISWRAGCTLNKELLAHPRVPDFGPPNKVQSGGPVPE